MVQGRLFGMGQSKAHQWIHVLLGVLQVTLRGWGMPPVLTELAKRLGVTEADAAAGSAGAGTAEPSEPPSTGAAPPLGMMALSGASGVPRID